MLEPDLDEVMRIEKASFRHAWRRSFFVADINRSSSLAVTAWNGLRLVGYAVAWRTGDEFHLANIAVDPGLRHQGIGDQLLRYVTDQGRADGLRRICLEVRPTNETARRFYRKHGFFHVYTRERYYPDGEDALILERDL
jgi:ribosomal-protein-alanine N-acetyltransferase